MFFGQTCLNPQIVRQRRENSTRKQSYMFLFMAVLYLETYHNISFICSTQIKIHPTPSPRLCDVTNLLLLEVNGFLWVYWHEFWLSVALRRHFSCRRSEMFKSKDVWNKRTMKHSYYSLYPWYLSTQSSPKRLHMSTKTKWGWLPGAQQRRCSAEKVICLICCFKLSLTQNRPLQEPEEASRLEKSPRNLTRRRHVVWADTESSGLWWSQNKLPESWPCFNISFRNDLSDNTRAEW